MNRQVEIEGLPDGWIAMVSAQNGGIYFVGPDGRRQSQVPPGFADAPTGAAAHSGDDDEMPALGNEGGTLNHSMSEHSSEGESPRSGLSLSPRAGWGLSPPMPGAFATAAFGGSPFSSSPGPQFGLDGSGVPVEGQADSNDRDEAEDSF